MSHAVVGRRSVSITAIHADLSKLLFQVHQSPRPHSFAQFYACWTHTAFSRIHSLCRANQPLHRQRLLDVLTAAVLGAPPLDLDGDGWELGVLYAVYCIHASQPLAEKGETLPIRVTPAQFSRLRACAARTEPGGDARAVFNRVLNVVCVVAFDILAPPLRLDHDREMLADYLHRDLQAKFPKHVLDHDSPCFDSRPGRQSALAPLQSIPGRQSAFEPLDSIPGRQSTFESLQSIPTTAQASSFLDNPRSTVADMMRRYVQRVDALEAYYTGTTGSSSGLIQKEWHMQENGYLQKNGYVQEDRHIQQIQYFPRTTAGMDESVFDGQGPFDQWN